MSGAAPKPLSGQQAEQDCSLEIAPDGRASLAGPLTFETVARLFRALEQSSPGNSPVEQFDLGGVTMIDSAGLALLLEWQSRSRAGGREITVSNAPDGLLRLARLCEAVELLNISGRAGEPGSAR